MPKKKLAPGPILYVDELIEFVETGRKSSAAKQSRASKPAEQPAPKAHSKTKRRRKP